MFIICNTLNLIKVQTGQLGQVGGPKVVGVVVVGVVVGGLSI